MSVISPCVAICVMNGTSNLCEGCSRTLTEIGEWFDLSDDDKRAIIADLPNRDPFAAKVFPGANRSGTP